MTKKKILSLCMVTALTATAFVGGTLAYFTDTDAQTNTFTVGNVAIDLFEDFGDNDAQGVEKLIPATGSAQKGTLKNGIEKEVYVENTGSEDAYVRVYIAIPQILDNGADTFDAGKNVLHFNYADESIGSDKWDWSKVAKDDKYVGDWNYYETVIKEKVGEQEKDVKYNVYVVTYEKALDKNEVTVDAMSQVYLDSKVTNEDITKIKEALGENWKIYVAAEGAQKEGFETAHEALNAALGTPTADDYKPAFDWNEVAGKTWVDGENK